MTQRNDGGQEPAMDDFTVRDYFAAKAMQGDIAACAEKRPDPTECAAWAYQMADCMLAARERT